MATAMVTASCVTGKRVSTPASAPVAGRPAVGPRIALSRAHTAQVATAVTAIRRTTASRGTSRPRTARQAMTPAEPSQYAEVTSHRIAGGGGFRAWTMPNSEAELARLTGMDSATTTTAR